MNKIWTIFLEEIKKKTNENQTSILFQTKALYANKSRTSLSFIVSKNVGFGL